MANKGIAPLLQRFEVTAYGCHEEARRRLLISLEESRAKAKSPGHSIETFFFTEYFSLQPLLFSETRWHEAKLYFPFIRRIVDENQFLWTPNRLGDDLRLQPKAPAILSKFADHTQFILSLKTAGEGAKVFRKWRLPKSLTASSRQEFLSAQFRDKTITPTTWEKELTKIKGKPNAREKTILLKEFGLIGQPWRASEKRCILYTFPIASDAVFYGYFILILQATRKANDLRKLLRELFPKLATEIYLPVLALLHESLFEQNLSAHIEETLKSIRESPSRKSVRLSKYLARQSTTTEKLLSHNEVAFLHDADTPWGKREFGRRYSDLEGQLHDLWVRRRELFDSYEDPDPARFPHLTDDVDRAKERLMLLNKTLLFDEYQVASPGLVEAVEKVISGARLLRPPSISGGSLPSALVYGTPGSGKDTLARMIPIFSPQFFAKDIHTVNMSALRPDFLTGPLLQGLIVKDSHASPPAIPGKKAGFFLDGLFGAASEATFILDELNSLDIDLQGILLRILEQGEVTPLLDLESRKIRHLIIGIVNEDPEDISRQTEMGDLLLDKGRFGSLISGLLYEVVRRSRRLRDDLFHRLRRHLYVTVPNINDRREDIPILFYSHISSISKSAGWKGLRVDLPSYRALMDKSINWRGNIRDVQAVAGLAVAVAKEMGDEGHISQACVRKALHQFFVRRGQSTEAEHPV